MLFGDDKFSELYQEAVNILGPPVSKLEKRHNHKQIYFEVIDSIVGTMNERFKDIIQYAFLDLVNPKIFAFWGGVIPFENINVLKEMYGPLYDIPMLKSQLSSIFRVQDFHKDT